MLSLLGVFMVFFIVHFTKMQMDTIIFLLIVIYFPAAMGALYFLVRVIVPRVKNIDTPNKDIINPTFFGGISQFASPEDYGKYLRKITQDDDNIVVHGPWGDALFKILPRFTLPGSEVQAGGLIAPMPGKVIDLKVKVGSKVKKGDTLVILEAMKMEHQVKASEDGKVTKVLIKKDDQLENGALLMVVDN